MLDILNTVNQWLAENRRIALATVVETWGSAPRRAGAKMGVDSGMAMIGSVSGGCVETAVVEEALGSLSDGKPRLLEYGVSDDDAWNVGLACGGRISIYVEALDSAWWQIAAAHVREDRALATAIILNGGCTGMKVAVDDSGIVYSSPALPPEIAAALGEAAYSALDDGGIARIRVLEQDILLDVYRPRPRLVIVGGAHTAMALKDFAHALGFRVIIIDPRQAFATQERFPDVELISHRYPDKVLAEIGMTKETYLAILTHDPKIDDPALRAALPSDAPYIGVLSSKRTHEKRLERLAADGVDPSLFPRIHTPIGLAIGAVTPEEIALSIMAEIVAVRNGARA